MAAQTPRVDKLEAAALTAGALAKAQGFTTLVDASLISVPYTTIVNRAAIPDLANDCAVRFGIDRIQTQRLYTIIGEQGPNGEPVWGVEGDALGQIRFFGSGAGSYSTTNGAHVGMTAGSASCEITFYGTGLNALITDPGARTFSNVKFDGGSLADVNTATQSSVLGARNYSPNIVVPVVSNQTLGLHTVSFSAVAANIFLAGFEILNESTALNVRPGKAYGNNVNSTIPSASTPAYASSFESGVLDAARGGRVLIYAKSDGTVAKALTPVNAAAAYLTSTDHTNEEIVRFYNWREFGCGRADDFSTHTGGLVSRAFTLDDGTTTLIGYNLLGPQTGDGLTPDNAGGAYMTFTFIGTGLDVQMSTATTVTTVGITIDGVSVGNLTGALPMRTKICSGLPYGTHTVKMGPVSAGSPYFPVRSFIVYSPKKPTLPTGAIELGEYYIMPTYAANTVAGLETIATGVLRKHITREWVATGGGTAIYTGGLSLSNIGGWALNVASGAYVELTFFGTGAEFRCRSNTVYTNSVTVTINGSAATTTNFPTLTSAVYGGLSYSSAPGGGTLSTAVANNDGAGLKLAGLPLGRYTLRFLTNAASFIVDALDIITPIHCPKPNKLTEIQDTLPVGSCAIGDSRTVSLAPMTTDKQTALVNLIATNTTSSAGLIPIAGFGVPFIGKNKKVNIFYSIKADTNTTTTALFAIFVDGVRISEEKQFYTSGSGAPAVSDMIFTTLSTGAHWIQIYHRANGGGTIGAQAGSTLLVEEL